MIQIILTALISVFGTFGAVLLIVFLNPRKVQLWVSWIYRAALLVTEKAEFAYIANNVAGNINVHIGGYLLKQLSGLTANRVEIKWHNDAATILEEAEGTIIVRMRPHQQRIVNTLHAYAAVTPRLVVPAIRSRLMKSDSDGIDLHLCRRFAEQLSKSATVVFRTDILDPALTAEPELADILGLYGVIDDAGLFIGVFLQELIKLNNSNPIVGLEGLKDEARKFYKFLRDIAQRAPGAVKELSFYGQWIRVNILLVAKSETRALGLNPYRRRVSRELAKGVETIYLLATDSNIGFARKVANAFDADMRLIRTEEKTVIIKRGDAHKRALIVPFERNEGYSFRELAGQGEASPEFATGRRAKVFVTDVQAGYAVVDWEGVQASIPSRELSWSFTTDCREVVRVGDEIEVEILEHDEELGELYVSRKRCEPNPFDGVDIATVEGRTVRMRVQGSAGRAGYGQFLFGNASDNPIVPLRLYDDELSWGGNAAEIRQYEPGSDVDVKIVHVNTQQGYASCSVKRLHSESWDKIRAAYPPGRQVTATVKHVAVSGVTCVLEPGLVGFVPEDEFRHAGLEYADFERNLSEGQILYVVVSRVVAGKRQRISLRLQANA